uniref:leucine--tRNA ligase n=1 Tax=Arion vulgaris TaxID=1028688 RepID=A0A0B7AFM5_9EUPU
MHHQLSQIVFCNTLLPTLKRRCIFWHLYSVSVRSIFSKTGKWDSHLSLATRLEIEDHWRPIIQQLDHKHSELVNSPAMSHKEKYYALSMFPYPSGNLHLGHVRVYTISDVMARYQRSNGKIVVHPMGWDAFGLPAENAAIERGIHPKDWTYSNIDRMRQQLQGLGFSFDWSREVATCDSTYYRWTQFIFLKMFEHGLAFQKKGLVNWDPVDMTVLANEQIDDTGHSWRSGATVEKKYLTQWYLRSTAYSQSLLDGLSEVDRKLWLDIILLQKNWIGECCGHRIDFNITYDETNQTGFPLSIYTEHLDLIFGVSHLSVKPSHYLCVDFDIYDKGAVLPVTAVHPFTGDNLKVIVRHEKDMYPNRDVMLAIPCISKEDKITADRLNIPYRDVLDLESDLLRDSEELSGLSREEALKYASKKAAALGIGGEKINESLNDWLVSRQRYWGTPIPIIHCKKCGSVPVPYEDLPVELPDTKLLISKGSRSPLADNENWVNVSCPKCGTPAQRETDTMDTFVDSTWYFLRYLDPHNKTMPFDPQVANKLMPVDLYIGGKEHAVLHLYFARFVCHFLHSLGYLTMKEPFKNLLTQGMIKGESYRVKTSGKYLPRDQVDLSGAVPVEAETGAEVLVEWDKMSKSKYNGVNPEDILEEFGVDTTRLCMLSNVSPQSDRNWSNIVFKGVLAWQSRIWSLVTKQRQYCSDGQKVKDCLLSTEELDRWDKKIDETRNHIINHVNLQFDKTFNINSAVSRLHSYVTWLLKVPPEIAAVSKSFEQALADLIIMLSPMSPHFASELWVGLADVAQHQTHQWELPVMEQPWPKLDDNCLMPLVCKINDVSILEVGVPYKDVETLNTTDALSLLQKDSIFQEKFSHYSIQNVSLRVEDDHKAILHLTIPEFDFGIDGSSSEKKKKKMKLSKQRKKLHTMDINER